jgi:hypothetical protein
MEFSAGTHKTSQPALARFPGMEKTAIDEIAAWMDKPAS